MKLKLSNGGYALVDREDYDMLMAYGQWFKTWTRNTWRVRCYDKRKYKAHSLNKSPMVSLHTLILDEKPGMVIDHKNEDGLDNRRKNLQHITNAHNVFKTSRTKGYYLDKKRLKWYARARFGGKTRQLGYFDTEREAREARDLLREQGLEYFRCQ